MPYPCAYCDRKPFATANGLANHLARSLACQRERSASFGVQALATDDDGFLKCLAANMPAVSQIEGKTRHVLSKQPNGLRAKLQNFDTVLQQYVPNDTQEEGSDDEDFGNYGNDEDEDDTNVMDQEPSNKGQPDESMSSTFQNYCQESYSRQRFSKQFEDAIRLMAKLRQSKASLATYDSILEWHF